jgi:hypothetical protein
MEAIARMLARPLPGCMEAIACQEGKDKVLRFRVARNGDTTLKSVQLSTVATPPSTCTASRECWQAHARATQKAWQVRKFEKRTPKQ